MADYATPLDLITTEQAAHEVTANNALDEASPAMFGGRRAVATAALTWGVRGGRSAATSVGNQTVTLTPSTTNYVVIHRTTLVASVSTSNTNWNDTTTYGRCYLVTTGPAGVTNFEDWRGSTGGINNPTAAAAGALLAANNLLDVVNAGTSRTNLGLGTAATHAAGDFALVANNLSDVNAASARTNLGLGTAAVLASSALIHADGSIAFAADQSLGSHKLTNVTDPSSAQDAATKAYVDALAVNLGKRARVRAATTANITIATALNNADTLDGVTLATGDLVLVKDQSAPAENGVYVVGVSPARDAQFDTYNEHPGSLLAVEEGSNNADTLWLCTSNDGGTLNTTAIAFSSLSVSAAITQLTGDGAAGPGSGSQALTLATVNSNVGSFGDGTHVAAMTVNGKGLATAASSVAITGAALTEAPNDQAYTGVVVSFTYGESLTPGAAVYFKSDGKVWKADANGSSTYPCIGIALETASSGSHLVLLLGIYRDDALFNWTVGGLIYLSTTAGGLTQTAPTSTDDVVQIVGIATHADRMFVSPQLNYVTHT